MFQITKPDKPAWAGPFKGGLTQSIINRFLDCPFRFYLYAVLGLEDPENINPNLMWGSICHRGLEYLLSTNVPVAEFDDATKADLLQTLKNYTTKEYPQAPASFPYSAYEMCLLYDDTYKQTDDFKAEVKFSATTHPLASHTTARGNQVTFRGKLDGEGHVRMAEHKCVGYSDPQQSRLETPEDLQLNLYMYITGIRECIYDKIKIPDTNKWCPQKRSAERSQNWIERIYHTHYYKEYPIAKNKFLWMDQFVVYRTDEEIDTYFKFVIEPLVDLMCAYWEYVNSDDFDPNDPRCYNELFYIKPLRTFDASRTEKYKCNYYNLLNGQIGLDELQQAHFYAELDDV
jgi:hypothetical protein